MLDSDSELEGNKALWASFTEAERRIRRLLVDAAYKGDEDSDPITYSRCALHTTALYDGCGVYGFAVALDNVRLPFLVVAAPLGSVEDVALVQGDRTRSLTRRRGRRTAPGVPLIAAVTNFLEDRGLAERA